MYTKGTRRMPVIYIDVLLALNLWIDFIPDESGLTYLDEVHKPV